MNYLKRNKSTIIAIAIFLIVLIVAMNLINIFFPNEENALYGSRLNGINEVKITNNTEDQITAALEKDCSKVSIRESGKIIEVILTVDKDMSLETAKNLAPKITEQLKKEQLEYYDIQVFIQKTAKSSDFPIIGYKQHTKEGFNWTKDRTGNE